MMIRKWFLFFLMGTLCHAADGRSSVIYEIQEGRLLRHVARVAAKIVYDHSSLQLEAVQKVHQPNAGTVLSKNQLETFFHNEAGQAINAHYSSFCVGGIKGCVYTVDENKLRKKIFVAFPGTQSAIEWSKNFFGITSFKHNVQQSYYDDIEILFSSTSEFAFFNVLRKHIANEGKSTERDEKTYEYYFVGHSRGGGLASLAAKRFSQEGREFIGDEKGRVKIITFCAPRIANAHKEQFLWVESLNFSNIVHFISPSDIAPQFPFRFVENYGVKIPLRSSWSAKKSHEIPTEEEMDLAVQNFSLAQDIGWMDPLRNFFILDTKSILWGLGGIYLMYSASKYANREVILEALNWIHKASTKR